MVPPALTFASTISVTFTSTIAPAFTATVAFLDLHLSAFKLDAELATTSRLSVLPFNSNFEP